MNRETVPDNFTGRSLADIVGTAFLGPKPCLVAPLDELIFGVTTAALRDAQMALADIDAVYMATSDVFDGRAISTMTLTASTGSFGKHEMRVCDDGLGALALAADGLRSGSADAALVTSWSKLSEANLDVIDPLAIEPAFHRPLGLRSSVVAALQRSSWKGHPTTVVPAMNAVGDAAVSLVLVPPDARANRRGRLLGAGWSSGPYLRPDGTPLRPLTEAVARALADASLESDGVDGLHCGGFFDISDEELADAAGVSVPVHRSGQGGMELGYASGLLALIDALASPGRRLVVSRAGIGTSRAYAVVVEGTR